MNCETASSLSFQFPSLSGDDSSLCGSYAFCIHLSFCQVCASAYAQTLLGSCHHDCLKLLLSKLVCRTVSYISSVSLLRCSLLCRESVVLQLLGSRIAFEIAVGFNGRVWVRASTNTLSIRAANCITAAATKKDPAMIQAIVDAVLQR